MEPEPEPSPEPPEESDPSLTLDLGITIVIGVVGAFEGALVGVARVVVVVEGAVEGVTAEEPSPLDEGDVRATGGRVVTGGVKEVVTGVPVVLVVEPPRAPGAVTGVVATVLLVEGGATTGEVEGDATEGVVTSVDDGAAWDPTCRADGTCAVAPPVPAITMRATVPVTPRSDADNTPHHERRTRAARRCTGPRDVSCAWS